MQTENGREFLTHDIGGKGHRTHSKKSDLQPEPPTILKRRIKNGKYQGNPQKFVADNPSNSFLVTINPCLNNAKSLLETEIQREDICKLFPFSNAYDNENYTYAELVAMAQFMDMKV